jgi:DNA-binding SARP family transcriptional activator/TolB-like protein
VLAQPKRLALLTYLAVARPHGSHRRDRLLAMFWPDSDDEHARAALSRAIYFLRRVLGDGVIVSRGDEELSISADHFWCDAAEFDTQLEQGRSREALELYHGDLLPGFFTSDANGFEEWLEREREYLRDRASQAALKVADAEEANGNLPLAVHWARRSVERAPFSELGLRRLLALLDAVGDRAAAEEAYQKFAAHMSSELELAPGPETRTLIERIRARELNANPPDVAANRDAGKAPIAARVALSTPVVAMPVRAPSRRWRILVAAAIVAAVTTPALLLARGSWRHLDTHRVLVTRFSNLTGDDAFDALGRVAADRIVQSLAGTGLVEVVDPSTLRGVPLESTVSDRQAITAEEATRRRAGLMVTGEIHRDGSRLIIQAWITDVARGRIVWAIPEMAGSVDSIRYAIEEVRERMTGAVVALNTARFATWFPAATSPPRFTAFQEFAQGVELQLRGADSDAMSHLRRALDLDSTFSLGELQLAQAHLNNFEEAIADSIAAGLNRKRERLTPLQRHWLDWMLAHGAEDPLSGYRAISAAAALAPERFLPVLAWSAFRVNRPGEAARILEQLGPDSPYNSGTEYWGLLSRSYHALGEHKRELATARAARERYADRIDIIGFELAALAAAGRVGELRALLDTVLAFPRPKVGVSSVIADMPGHGHWPGRLMVPAAAELRTHGYAEAADEVLSRAIEWYRSQSTTGEMAKAHRFELARALYQSRDWSAAEEMFRSLAAADTTDFVSTGFLGTIAARKGDSTTARRILAKFDTLRPTLSRPNAIAGYWQAKISALLGDHAGAMKRLSDAFGPQGRPGHSDFDFEALWRSRAFRDFKRLKG